MYTHPYSGMNKHKGYVGKLDMFPFTILIERLLIIVALYFPNSLEIYHKDK